ncbi:MAG: ATP-dependent nuclease, partial [Anaerolineaceae bacterium]
QRNADFEYCRFVLGLKTLIEDCSQRLSGPFNATINKIKDPFSNIVHFLNVKRELFDEISKHIKSVFGFGIIFDDLVQGEKEIRIEPRTPITDENRKNPEEQVKYWEENSKSIAYQGDGIKAYLKICYALFNPAKSIILIDEPETFLHPPQRIALGKFISTHAKSGKQLFISTHDSEIVRGILNNGSKHNIKIFHLRNKNNNFSFVCNEGKDLSGSRQINESNLNSFFHKMTVLCEAEDDRMIYQYSAGKFFPDKANDVNFIGNNGKPETIKSLEFLRSLKLNACCIFDVDALYTKEILADFIGHNDENKKFICELVDEISTTLSIGKEDSRKNEFKEKGVDILSEELKQRALKVIELLSNCGIYIIKRGCLESWIEVDKSEKKKVQIMLNKIDTKDVSELKFFMQNVISYQNT